MQNNVKAQGAAILGILLLATLSVAPWLTGSHILRPKAEQWHKIIARKDELLAQKEKLWLEIQSFQNMPEKKEVNSQFRKNIESSNVDSLQGFINNGKFAIFNFKTTQIPDTKETRFSFVASYNELGKVLSEIWNSYQFLDINSVVMKANPNRPDDEVVATISVRLPTP